MSRLFQVSDENFDEEIIHSGTMALVDFWAEWCQPCKAMELTIEELAQKYKGKVKVVKLNVVENIQTPARFGVRNLPTLMFFKGGEMVHTIVGTYPKTVVEEALRKLF